MKRASDVPPVVLSAGLRLENGLDGTGHQVAQGAGRSQEGFAGNTHVHLITRAQGIEFPAHPIGQRPGGVEVVEADVEAGGGARRDHVGGRVADIDGRDLQAGSLEIGRALVERLLDQGRQHPHQVMVGVVGQMRVGDMALLAQRGHFEVHRATPADLGHIAQLLLVGRLADHAGVDRFPAFGQGFQHLDRAVDARTFLVASDQQAD